MRKLCRELLQSEVLSLEQGESVGIRTPIGCHHQRLGWIWCAGQEGLGWLTDTSQP
jgi:hypothetical protein